MDLALPVVTDADRCSAEGPTESELSDLFDTAPRRERAIQMVRVFLEREAMRHAANIEAEHEEVRDARDGRTVPWSVDAETVYWPVHPDGDPVFVEPDEHGIPKKRSGSGIERRFVKRRKRLPEPEGDHELDWEYALAVAAHDRDARKRPGGEPLMTPEALAFCGELSSLVRQCLTDIAWVNLVGSDTKPPRDVALDRQRLRRAVARVRADLRKNVWPRLPDDVVDDRSARAARRWPTLEDAVGPHTHVPKPSGWTRVELIEQANYDGDLISPSTFDKIRKKAGIAPGRRGGAGAHRRYSMPDLKKLIEAARSEKFRKGRKVADRWNELLQNPNPK